MWILADHSKELNEQALLYIGNRLDEIAKDFSPGADPKAAFMCKLIQEIAELYFNLYTTFGIIKANPTTRSLIQSTVKFAKKLGEMGLDEGLSDAVLRTKEVGEEKSGKSRWFTMPPDLSKDRCSINFQDYAIDKYGRGSKMKDNLSRSVLNITVGLEDPWDHLVSPGSLVADNATDIQTIDMDDWIDDATWTVTWQEMLRKIPKILKYISLEALTHLPY